MENEGRNLKDLNHLLIQLNENLKEKNLSLEEKMSLMELQLKLYKEILSSENSLKNE